MSLLGALILARACAPVTDAEPGAPGPSVVSASFGLEVSGSLPVNGGACSSGSDCPSGHCVDGVCCDSACGGGVDTDCQACSVARGAATNGVCGPVAATHTCRTAAAACDVAETCDGTSLSCGPDERAADGESCGAGGLTCQAGQCVSSAPTQEVGGRGCASADASVTGLFLLVGAALWAGRRRRGAVAR